MLELFVLSGPDAGLSVRLQPGDAIGRAEASALRLHDRSISRRHAQLQERGSELVIVDLNSTNGLHLADARVPEVTITDFLEFRVGEVLLRARLGTHDEPSSTAPEPPQHISLIEGKPAPAPEVSFSFGGGATAPAAKASEPDLEIEWDEEDSAEPAPAKPSLRDEQRAQLLSDLKKPTGGLLRADLSQYPGWAQALIAVIILGVGAAIFFGIYTLVLGTRS